MIEKLAIHLTPLINPGWLYGFGGLGLILIVMALRARASGCFWRCLSLALVLTALANPIVEHARVQPVKDTMMLVVDDTASISLPGRQQQITAALPAIRDALHHFAVHVAKDGELFPLGKIQVEVLHTPGHTLESSCFLVKDENGKTAK